MIVASAFMHALYNGLIKQSGQGAHFLPEQNLRGKAFLIWMHWDGSAGGVDFHRIGDSIQ